MKKLIISILAVFTVSCSSTSQSESLILADSVSVDTVKCVAIPTVCIDSMCVKTVTDSIVK